MTQSNFKFFELICLFLSALILGGCQPSSPFERRPGLFKKPHQEEKLGRIHFRTYIQSGFASRYPFSILEIDGREISLREAHIRYPVICTECVKIGREAVAFQLFSSNENLRGVWVLQIINNEQKFFHLCSTYAGMRPWEIMNYSCGTTFNAETGECAPNECKSYSSLIE